MTPDALEVGKRYPGDLPENDASVLEFSKEGPELRLFYSRIPREVVDRVRNDDCYLGLLRSGDIAVVPWKIGDVLGGDTQFHVFLYPPETRPTPEILTADGRYEMLITLVDRDNGLVQALRRVRLSSNLSKKLNEIIAYQHGNHIGREEYDAQVDIYQSHFPDVVEAIAAAEIFEKAEAHPG